MEFCWQQPVVWRQAKQETVLILEDISYLKPEYPARGRLGKSECGNGIGANSVPSVGLSCFGDGPTSATAGDRVSNKYITK